MSLSLTFSGALPYVLPEWFGISLYLFCLSEANNTNFIRHMNSGRYWWSKRKWCTLYLVKKMVKNECVMNVTCFSKLFQQTLRRRKMAFKNLLWAISSSSAKTVVIHSCFQMQWSMQCLFRQCKLSSTATTNVAFRLKETASVETGILNVENFALSSCFK